MDKLEKEITFSLKLPQVLVGLAVVAVKAASSPSPSPAPPGWRAGCKYCHLSRLTIGCHRLHFS